jgi:Protein of unknown function (DUF2851)
MPHPVMSWHTLYPTVPASAWVAEAPVSWHRTIPEKLVRCLWFDQRWRPSPLRTLDGQEVMVHSPGRWNLQAGPDFQQASIAFIDGIRHRGDVEIHRYASGWTAHRHHLDARYNNVILHVFLWNDRQASEVRRADGQLVPQVALEQFLPRPLAAYQADIVLEDYPYKTAHGHGRCYETLQPLAPQEVCEVLDRAGDTRLQQRVWRWSRREGEVGLMQVMYEAVLRTLGSTGHRQHFQTLARTISWDELQRCLSSIPLQERGLAAEALLLGIAGILPYNTCMYGTMDAETRQYVMALQNYWHTFPTDIQQCAWHDMNWRQPNVRPANTPERRLAGMAQILAHYHGTSLFDAAVALCHTSYRERAARPARTLVPSLARLLHVPTRSYWTRRAHLGGRISKGQRLIGTQRARTVVVDAILPVLMLYAQHSPDAVLREHLLAGYRTAPLLPDNHVLRYMHHRMLGNDPALLGLVAGARQQQGLLQLFTDFCGNDEGNCQGCDFPLA